MAIYLNCNQGIVGFRLDGILYFDEGLLRVWVLADNPTARHVFIDVDGDWPQVEVQAMICDPLNHLLT